MSTDWTWPPSAHGTASPDDHLMEATGGQMLCAEPNCRCRTFDREEKVIHDGATPLTPGGLRSGAQLHRDRVKGLHRMERGGPGV